MRKTQRQGCFQTAVSPVKLEDRRRMKKKNSLLHDDVAQRVAQRVSLVGKLKRSSRIC